MKRLILILAAATSLAASGVTYAGEGGGHGRWAERAAERGGPPGQARRYEQGRGPAREDYPSGARGRWADAPRGRYEDAPRGRYEEAPRGRYEEAPRRYEEAPRGRYEGRYDGRYDEPAPSYVRPGFAPRPGGYLPPDYRGAPVGDYQRYRLRPPPRGYSWIHVGNGFALVSPDGQVFDVIQ